MTKAPRSAAAKPKRRTRTASSQGEQPETNPAAASVGEPSAHSAPVVAVFGGSGFIGRSLIPRLTAGGASVVVAARHPRSVDNEALASEPGSVKAVEASILSDDGVRSAVEGASVVINLVGILHESGDQTFEAVHVEGARRVAQAARDAGAERLVHMSALGADADSPSAYARTKAAGEQHVRDVFPKATILRPSIVFGPDDDFFNRFASMARFSPALPLIGGGRTRFQPVYVEDVARAIHMFTTDNSTKGHLYELGGPKVYTFRKLLELMLAQKNWRRALIPIPFALAEMQGSVLQMLPRPPLTRDQVESLKQDNVLSDDYRGFSDLGIEPAPLEDILPTYL